MKTTIIVPDDDWKAFHRKVLENEGQNRKGNLVIIKLIRLYIDGKVSVKA